MTPLPGSGAESELAHILDRHVGGWPGAGCAGAIVPGGLTVTTGDSGRVFAWASVTKLLTAIASLVALEEGVVGLDDPAGPRGSTLRHLLSHCSGLPFEGLTPVSRPGTRRIYSNTGVEIAASHLEARSGMAFSDYLAEGVLGPLGMMRSASVEGSAASGGRGSLEDLIALAAQMLSPSIFSPATWALATSVAFPGLVGVVPGFGRQDPCDWGLGPEIRGAKSPHWTGSSNSSRTFGHFGMSGSFVWVDPDLGVALCGLCSEPFGAWAKSAWPLLSDDVVAWARRQGCAPTTYLPE